MNNNPDEIFNKALNDIREESPDAEAAASRVWTRINPASIRGCDDFRALLPDFHAGKLSEARMMLVQDHLRECVACRKADRGAFRTPDLRAASLTPPYMHDGSLATLEEVVDFYDRGGGDGPGKSNLLTGPLHLSPQDKRTSSPS